MDVKIPNDELKRLEALFHLKILGTEGEDIYDTITKLTSEILEVPMAAISLVGEEKQWAKSIRGGAISEGKAVTSVARKDSFANIAIQTPDEPLIIKDTWLDIRVKDNPNVTGPPYVRFLVAVPFISNKVPIGALCVADTIPRKIPNEFQLESMKSLCKIIIAQLEIREFIVEMYEEIQELKNFPPTLENNAVLSKLYERFDVLAEKIKIRKQAIK